MRALSASPAPVRFLRIREVCLLTGLSRTTIFRLEKAGDFPAHIQLGPTMTAWVETEVAQWQADRIAASREAAA